jgi:pilus assembly protein Flp/PilA
MLEHESPMQKLFAHFVKDDSGATAIEYALIAAGISIVIVVSVQGIGTTLNNTFANVNSQLR